MPRILLKTWAEKLGYCNYGNSCFSVNVRQCNIACSVVQLCFESILLFQYVNFLSAMVAASYTELLMLPVGLCE